MTGGQNAGRMGRAAMASAAVILCMPAAWAHGQHAGAPHSAPAPASHASAPSARPANPRPPARPQNQGRPAGQPQGRPAGQPQGRPVAAGEGRSGSRSSHSSSVKSLPYLRSLRSCSLRVSAVHIEGSGRRRSPTDSIDFQNCKTRCRVSRQALKLGKRFRERKVGVLKDIHNLCLRKE